MSFDLDKLVDFAKRSILDFSKEHEHETFYGFSIDANLLCLNSVECFSKTLKFYKEEFPESYQSFDRIENLRCNTGDWEYQGFASFTKNSGFNEEAYDYHYNLGLDGHFEDLKSTEYAVVMGCLVEKLVSDKTFDCLNLTDDFFANCVEHNY